MTDRELMQQALDALIDAADSQNWEMQQNIDQHGEWYRRSVNLKQSTTNSQAAIEALRARLAQPEPEPVAWMEVVKRIDPNSREISEQTILRNYDTGHGEPLYTAPPQREWQGLTDEEKVIAYGMFEMMGAIGYAQAIEAKLKEKNT